MPTYAYECGKCGHRFERFHGMNETPVEKCPECGGGIRRVIGAGAGIIMKGDGGARRTPGGPSCGADRPCCGRETRCDRPPCNT